MQAVYFDMDGTIADLYNVPEWLPKLKNENPSPYADAAPLVDVDKLAAIIRALQGLGVVVGVISWGARGGSAAHTRQVKRVKRAWCERHGLTFDEFHVVKWGTPKQRVANIKNAALVDDEPQNLARWQGLTIDAKDSNMLLSKLADLLREVANERTKQAA